MIGFLTLVVTLVLIYSIAGYTFNIHYGFTGTINLGIAGFLAVGAYTTALLTSPPSKTTFAGETYHVGLGMPVFVGIIAGALVASLMALLIGLIAFRALSGLSLAILTLGTAEIIRYMAINEKWLTRGSLGIMNIPQPFYGVWKGVPYLLLLTAILFVVHFVSERLRTSPLGRVLRGIRADKLAMEALGKNTYYFQLISFTAAAAFAGTAGALWAHYVGAIQPQDFSTTLTFLVVSSVIVGGEGNNRGVFVGTAIVIGLLYQAPRFLPKIGNPWTIPSARFIIIGLVIILILQFKKEGILPKQAVDIEREWG